MASYSSIAPSITTALERMNVKDQEAYHEHYHAIASIFEPPAPTIKAVTDVKRFNKYPKCSRERELKRTADDFASSGRNAFVHFVEPILKKRKDLYVTKALNRKKHDLPAEKLWLKFVKDDSWNDELFFWHEMVAKVLRRSLSDGSLTHEACLMDAGRHADREACVIYAELAVLRYLDQDVRKSVGSAGGVIAEMEKASQANDVVGATNGEAEGAVATLKKLSALVDKIDEAALCSATASMQLSTTPQQTEEAPAEDNWLLDTLPDRFEVESRMLYSHFAHYELNTVRQAEGKHQTAMLRQLADLLDKTGKEFFYYYIVPRLYKAYYPRRDGTTLMSDAASIWAHMLGQEKGLWYSASAAVKKMLGDGDVDGLEMLELSSLEPQVLRLHGMAQKALQSHEQRRK